MNIKPYRELFSYIVAGILTTGVNFIIYYSMIYMNINYKVSNTAAFIVSVIFAFFVNKKYVFISDKDHINEFVKFLVSRIFTYILDISMMILLVDFLAASKYTAKIWTNIFIVFANYFISKYWTFKK